MNNDWLGFAIADVGSNVRRQTLEWQYEVGTDGSYYDRPPLSPRLQLRHVQSNALVRSILLSTPTAHFARRTVLYHGQSTPLRSHTIDRCCTFFAFSADRARNYGKYVSTWHLTKDIDLPKWNFLELVRVWGSDYSDGLPPNYEDWSSAFTDSDAEFAAHAKMTELHLLGKWDNSVFSPDATADPNFLEIMLTPHGADSIAFVEEHKDKINRPWLSRVP
jgi:hypothetical protein